MSLESDLYDTLKALVPPDHAYPDAFPQHVPWPAIRFSYVSVIPDVTICGGGDDTQSDFRIQIDGVTKLDVDRDALRLSIMTAMETFDPPAICDSWSKEYDPETKSYRVQLDYLLHPSTT